MKSSNPSSVNQASKPSSQPQYLVGIDLGTTHTLVAYSPIQERLADAEIKLLQIPQLVDRGEVSDLPQLPSFRFHPAPGQLNSADCLLPFGLKTIQNKTTQNNDVDVVFGEWARRLGVETQGRLVHSAKSWLSQSGATQAPPMLPWGNDDPGLRKVTAVEATTSYLQYICMAWNTQFPQTAITDQRLVITIPASFDEGARALTLGALEELGLGHAFLLEEPSAALYHWRYQNQQASEAVVEEGALILVCDVGGGTTDFTLVEASRDERTGLSLNKLAVGDHLLLGGDNMDWALAQEAQSALQATRPNLTLSKLQWGQLVQQCRTAKEQLLTHPDMAQASISLLGGGRKLVGGQLRTQLSRERLEALLVDGFFPKVSLDARPLKERSGLVAKGLFYAADAAISRHLAEFLCAHQSEVKDRLPTHILFNGGVFASDVFKQRLVEQLEAWVSKPVTVLTGTSVDTAVCLGAVVYGMAQSGAFSKIQGGSARCYFLRVASQEAEAEDQALCILPRGTSENNALTTEKIFHLRVGQSVRFDLLSSTQDQAANFGQIYQVADHWVRLPALTLALSDEEANDPGQSERKNSIEVKLVSELSELGVLILKCVEACPKPGQGGRTWCLDFNIRAKNAGSQNASQFSSQTADEALPSQWHLAKTYIAEVYGPSQKKPDPKQVKQLRVKLEKCLGPRSGWQTPLLRAMADQLLTLQKNRRRSPQHERLWLNLLGYGLRPGLGYVGDEVRIVRLKSLWSGGPAYPNEAQNWVDWWTCWRRTAAGLNADFQQQLWRAVKPLLSPSAAKSAKQQQQLKLKSLEQMVRLAGSLELISTEEKSQLADWLLKWAAKQKNNDAYYWALGRIASRRLLYGDDQRILNPEQVSHWLEPLLNVSWKKQPIVGFSVTLMGRRHSNSTMNIDSFTRSKIKEKLQSEQCPESWLKLFDQTEAMSTEDQDQVFGEALPLGLFIS